MKLIPLLTALVIGLNMRADTASWYGEEHRGKFMANGRPFNPDALTAASWFYPLGTRVRVTSGNANVVVTITDRGPARRLVRRGRVIDLSAAAFRRLAGLELGLVEVTIIRE
jgi:peptidoglycan lytic transglycosylase